MIKSIWLLLLPMLILIFAGSACADVIELKTGKIEGKIQDETAEKVAIQTEAGLVVINRADIVNIKRGATPRELFAATFARLKDDDLMGHLALASYCKEHNLQDALRQLYEKVLEIDPDNQKAREGLGYVRQGGQWTTEDEVMRAKGLTRFKGKWMSPEEIQLTKSDEASLQWETKLRSLTFGAAQGNRSAAEEIAGIRDPNAVAPLINLIYHKSQDVGLAVISALANIPGPETAAALADAAFNDRLPSVRAAATQALAGKRSREALAAFSTRSRYLMSKRLVDPAGARKTRNLLENMAVAIGDIGDPLAIPLLIRMLSVRLNLVDDDGNIAPQAYFSSFAAPNALSKLTGESFGSEPHRWQAWWVDHRHELVGDQLDEEMDRLR